MWVRSWPFVCSSTLICLQLGGYSSVCSRSFACNLPDSYRRLGLLTNKRLLLFLIKVEVFSSWHEIKKPILQAIRSVEVTG